MAWKYGLSILVLYWFSIQSLCNAENLITSVPLFACEQDEPCSYRGEFEPNGTLQSSEAHYFSIDLTSVTFPDQQGLAVWLSTLKGKVGWYINKDNGQMPSDKNNYDGTITACQEKTQTCSFVLNGIGACEPDHVMWLLGVHNLGDSNSTYSMIVEIQAGGTDLNCGTAKSVIIILVSVVGGVLLFCTCICLVCLFFARDRSARLREDAIRKDRRYGIQYAGKSTPPTHSAATSSKHLNVDESQRLLSTPEKDEEDSTTIYRSGKQERRPSMKSTMMGGVGGSQDSPFSNPQDSSKDITSSASNQNSTVFAIRLEEEDDDENEE